MSTDINITTIAFYGGKMSKFDCNGDMNFIYPRKLDLKFSTEGHLYLDDQSTVTVYETGFRWTYLG